MRGLIEKDFRLILLKRSTLLIYLAIGVFFTWQFSDTFSGAYMTMLGTFLALSTLSYDDSDKCMEFLFTLPFTRKQYVAEKYIFVYGFAFLSGLIGSVVVIFACLSQNIPVGAGEILELVVSELPIVVFMGGIMIPLQLKFGAEKTRVVLLVIVGFVVAFVVLLTKVPVIENLFMNLKKVCGSLNEVVSVILILAIIIVITAVSFLASLKIIEKKEF